MKLFITKLNFTSPLHLGTGSKLESTGTNLEADRLFSAFCNGYIKLYSQNELEQLLSKSPFPFRFSSAFPFYKDRLFFPWPAGIPAPQDMRDKEIDKPRYVEKDIFESILQDKSLAEMETEHLLQNESIWGTKNYDTDYLWTKENIPRVALDRESKLSSYFHLGRTAFNEKAGFFFLIKLTDGVKKNYLSFIENVFRLLADEGIGGERSTGCGQFKPPIIEDIKIQSPGLDSAPAFVSLSPYFPQKEELQDFRGYYFLEEKSGWIYSPQGKDQKKRKLRRFATGSIFENKNQQGKLKDVSPAAFNAHKVYSYGLPFKVGLGVAPWMD